MAITKTTVGIYTTDGTTLTRVAQNTANLTSGLLDTNTTAYYQAPAPATVTLYPGVVYYIGVLVDADTAGTLFGLDRVANVPAATATYYPVPMYTLAGQTDLDATEAISGLTGVFDLIPLVGVSPA